jgi:tetratricopeptide (TPR) repeat protein
MVRSHIVSALLACALVLSGSSSLPAAAADTWPVARGPSREPVPYRFDPRLLKSVPKEFIDDAGACVVYSGTNYLVEADGTIETVTHEITRLNGRKAIDKLGEYRNITYSPAHQKLTLNEALIHKADGRKVGIQPRNVQLRDVSTDYQSYDSDKQLIISFPSLGVGDVIEVKWTVRGKNPEHGGEFFARYSFGDTTYPVVLDELRIRLPKTKPLKYAAVHGKIEPAITDTPAGRLYHWKAQNSRKGPSDENLPSKEELRPNVACSTFRTWEEVGAWKKKLRAACWECTPEVRKLVKEITAGLTTPQAKARALTYWVRRNVRYISAGEKHDYTPHLPATVLANRFGDCKDTSQLLAVMLREAGIQVELASLGAVDDGQVLEAVPSPWATHAILLVTIAGKQHWIDTTTRLAGWDFLPRDDRDRLCYLTDEKGKVRLVRTPALAADDNKVEQVTEVWVGADGSTRSVRTVVSHGNSALGQRDNFVETPPGERRRQVTADLQDANSRTKLVHLEVDEKALDDYDQPVRSRFEFELPRHFSKSGEDLEGSITDSKVWGRLLAYNLDYDRKAPLVFYAPFESTHRYIIHVHPAYRLDDLPRERTIGSKWGSFTIRTRALGDADIVRHLEVAFHTRLTQRRVDPADFDAFRRFHEAVNRQYRVYLTLKPTTDRASAPLLEALVAFTPQDNVAGAALANLYASLNRKNDAQRILSRALHFRPDDASLWELSAKVAQGSAAEEAAQRELVRRFPEEVKHGLTLGTTLVSRGKHEEARKLLSGVTSRGTSAQRAQAHYQLARSYFRKDEMKSALTELEQATSVDAEAVNTVSARLLEARVYDELNKPEDARRAYKRALDLNRDSEEALLGLLRLSMVGKQKMDALTYLRRYTLVVGDDIGGLLLAAEAYLQLDRPDDALELALRAREIKFHGKTQRILGLIYLKRGEHARAVQHLKQATRDAVVLAGLLKGLVPLAKLRELESYVEEAEQLERAPEGLRKLTARARQVLRRRAELGKLLMPPADREDEWDRALDAVACAEAMFAAGHPANQVSALLSRAFGPELRIGPAHALRGRLALERGKLALALTDAEAAIRLSSHDAGGHYVRGRVRLERNAAGALADLQKAAELTERKSPDVLHALADALFRSGKVAEALAAQREAVKLKPADKEMAEQLSALEKAARLKGAI